MVNCKISALFLARMACYPIWALLLFGQINPAKAAEVVEPQTLPQAQAALGRLEQQIASAQKATANDLKSVKQELALVRSFALDCVQQAAPKIQVLNNELSVLQPRKPVKRRQKRRKEPGSWLRQPSRYLQHSLDSCRICRAGNRAWSSGLRVADSWC